MKPVTTSLFGTAVIALVFVACSSNVGVAGDPKEAKKQQLPLLPPKALEAARSQEAWVRPASMGTRGAGVPDLWVRPGFKIDVVAKEPGARFLVGHESGLVFVSVTSKNKIVVYRLSQGKMIPSGDFLTSAPGVHGMQVVGDWLYYTQPDRIGRVKITPGSPTPGVNETVLTSETIGDGNGGHWWRSILVDGDTIYTSTGDPSNISDPGNEREKILAVNARSKERKLFSSGLRNTEKLVFQPGTKEIWGLDHGSDWFGQPVGDKKGRQPITDYNPSEELNHYIQDGFYGHPYIVGNRVPRYEATQRPDLMDLAERTIPPAYAIPAHSAGNGMIFYTGTMFPEMKGDVIACFHGSWNRSVRSGYSVGRILFDNVTKQPIGLSPLVVTLDANGNAVERPVDSLQLQDGSILFSSDATGNIFRLTKG